MTARLGEVKLISDGLILALDPASDLNYNLTEVEVLVVAGGGAGGGYGGNDGSGGGGAGGLIYKSNYVVVPNSGITVTVGNGAAGQTSGGTIGANGQNSVFGSLNASGGGGGGSEGPPGNRPGAPGGSGGGAGGYGVKNGGTGTIGQGFPGGNCTGPGDGGGGGAGAPGEDGGTGRGGDGLVFNISGKPKFYAGGGGAGGDKRNARGAYGGIGGAGGGGRGQDADNSVAALSGIPGTGAGGGGAAGSNPTYGAGTTLSSGGGGKGVVVVRYPGPQRATGGDIIESIGGYTIHTFNNSGTFTPLQRPSNGGNALGLRDLSANSSNFRVYGTATYNDSNGGSVTTGTGSGNYIECSRYDYNFQPQDPFSVFLWIYDIGNISSGSLDTGAIIANMYLGANPNGKNYPGWDLWVNDTASVAAHFIGSWTANAIKPGVDLNYSSYANSWLYLGYTYDGSTPTDAASALNSIDFYVNGSLHTTNKENKSSSDGFDADDSFVDYYPTQRLRLGARFGTGQESHNTFGPVHIYNRKLSASEILENYNTLKSRFGL